MNIFDVLPMRAMQRYRSRLNDGCVAVLDTISFLLDQRKKGRGEPRKDRIEHHGYYHSILSVEVFQAHLMILILFADDTFLRLFAMR